MAFAFAILLALVVFALWRWARANGPAGVLDRIDALLRGRGNVFRLAAAHYGPDPAQAVELWQPATQGQRRPLVVFIHGGGWSSGAAHQYRFVARAFGALGHPVALIGYRLVPEGRFPAMLEDCAAALAWLVRNAPAHDVDVQRLVLAGHSAGAYNAAMLALDPRWLRGAGLDPALIAGAIGLSGPYDFYPFTNPSAVAALGHVEQPEATQPIAFAAGAAMPFLLVHGSGDTLVKVGNARRLDTALREAGAASRLVELDGRGHAWTVMALARPFDRDRRLRNAVAQFLADVDGAAASGAVQRRIG